MTAFDTDATAQAERSLLESELLRARGLLDAILTSTEEIVYVIDPAGRVLLGNPALAEIIGVPFDKLIGTDLRAFLPADQRAKVRASDKQVLATGQRHEFEALVTVATGDRWMHSSKGPYRNAAGEIIGVVGMSRDVTAQHVLAEELRAERDRLARVLSVTDATVAAKDLQGMADELLQRLHRALNVDATALLLADPADPARLQVMASTGPRRPDRIVHARPGMGFAGRVLSERRPVHIPDVNAIAWSSPWVPSNLSSLVGVPVVREGVIYGLLHVGSVDPREFTEGDAEMLELVAVRLAGALARARLVDEQLRMSNALQRSLLPPDLPEIPGVEVAAKYVPHSPNAEIGGDFYDVYPVGPGRWKLVVGDVCGKGADAAALMALASRSLRAVAPYVDGPAGALRALNSTLLDAPHVTGDRFVTVGVVEVEPGSTGTRVTLSLGGHLPPLLVRRDGTVEEVGRTGQLIGVLEHPELHESVLWLAPGESLLLFTDGLVEQRGRDMTETQERLCAFLAERQDLGVEELLDAVMEEFVADQRDDDITAVLVRTA